MFEDIQFESERLITQPLSADDAPALFRIYSDVEAMQYRGSGPMKDPHEANAMIAGQNSVDPPVSKLRLGVRTKSNNRLIGTLLFTIHQDFKQQCEIGFSFGKAYWNKGYGRETLNMVEKQLKILSEIAEIKAWCIKENIASNKLFKNAGFSIKKQNEYPQSNLFIKQII